MAYSPVPAPLEQAIQKSSQQYDIPPDILEGIWRVESGSTYPNPAVNSLGYGGLFGTKDWEGTTQAQADYAASILHNLLVDTGGGIAPALSKYSGGGYSSVPGERTFGTIVGYAGKGGQSVVSEIIGGVKTGVDVLNNPAGLPGDISNIGGAASSAIGGVASGVFGGIAGGLEGLVLRGFFILIGIGLIVVGLGLIVWQLMGRVGAPGVIGMAQTQMRISQSASRTQESQRASMVRESQAEARLGEQRESRQLRERRLEVHEAGVTRREPEYRKFSDVKRDDRTVSPNR
jgi:hypothetical protein